MHDPVISLENVRKSFPPAHETVDIATNRTSFSFEETGLGDGGARGCPGSGGACGHAEERRQHQEKRDDLARGDHAQTVAGGGRWGAGDRARPRR